MLKPLFPPSCGVKGLNEENLAGRLLHGGEKHLLSRWEKKWSSLKYFFARKCQNIKEMRLYGDRRCFSSRVLILLEHMVAEKKVGAIFFYTVPVHTSQFQADTILVVLWIRSECKNSFLA